VGLLPQLSFSDRRWHMLAYAESDRWFPRKMQALWCEAGSKIKRRGQLTFDVQLVAITVEA
jgi:hypothetical protein